MDLYLRSVLNLNKELYVFNFVIDDDDDGDDTFLLPIYLITSLTISFLV